MSALSFEKRRRFSASVLCQVRACKRDKTATKGGKAVKAATHFAHILDYTPVPICSDCKLIWEQTWDELFTSGEIDEPTTNDKLAA